MTEQSSFEKVAERGEILSDRRCGNTTRIIDQMVQDIFFQGKVILADHYPGEEAKSDITYKFLKRMLREHNIPSVEGVEEPKRFPCIVVDKEKGVLYLLKNEKDKTTNWIQYEHFKFKRKYSEYMKNKLLEKWKI